MAAVAWRFGRGWTEQELASLLQSVDTRGTDLPSAPAAMTAEQGWNETRSHAVVAREPPGPPLPDGAFARARSLIAGFAHSDPRIVVAHFDPAVPLSGRPVLLELRAAGLRFLCPAVVRSERREDGARRSIAGFMLETLRGHLERGREWFLLEKDSRSGDVLFRIEALWRAGDFPGWWAWAGFQLLGRRSQRAWHRLAHVRLRLLVAADAEPPRAPALAHEGRSVLSEPISVYARRGSGAARTRLLKEEERMRWDRWLSVAGMGALAGARSMSAPAFAVTAAARQGTSGSDRLTRALTAPVASRAIRVLAASELFADKWSRIPSRTAWPSLAARAAAGALAADLLASRARRFAGSAALLGAAVAVTAAFATHRLRALVARSVPEPAAGLAEDALVLAGGFALLRRLGAGRGSAAAAMAGWGRTDHHA